MAVSRRRHRHAERGLTRHGQRYDLIIDNAGNRSIADYARALSPNGICVITGFTSIPLLLQHAALGPVVSRLGGKRIGLMLAPLKKQDLLALKALMEAGQVVPVVDRTYPLTAVPEAYRYLETKHARGKIVVTLG